MRRIASGTTDQYVYFQRQTGLSSFTVYRSRNGAAWAVMTSPTISEGDSSNAPGIYEILLDEDMTIGAGNVTEQMVFYITASGMSAVFLEVELFADVSAASIADAVWEEAVTDHSGTSGSTAEALNAAGSAGDPWTTSLPGSYTGSQAGKMLSDVLSDTNELQTDDIPTTLATLSTAASLATAQADLDTLTGSNGATLATSQPNYAPATATALATAQTSIDAIPTNAELSTALSTLNDLSAAEVNAEVVDALNTDTYAEPAQGAPGATVSLVQKIGYLYKAWRNKTTQTATQYSLYNDDAATVDHKATVSDDATTATKGEVGTGP